MIHIVRDDELTELGYMVCDPNGPSLTGTDLKMELGPGTPMTDVARGVIEMFEHADREKPRASRA